MINFPNAKINLGLRITEKRADGYHNIESCFYPIALEDVLEVIPSAKDEFIAYGADIPGDAKSNLILKAYELLKADFSISPIQISLYKHIPMGAGMGGGSADGAFMLVLLNKLFKLKLSQQALQDYALQLGSDCPFFIANNPAYVTGRGEAINAIKVDLKGYHLGFIFPGIHIGTKEAYSTITPEKSKQSVKSIIENRPIAEWKDHLINDFEKSVFSLHPSLKDKKEALYQLGAIYAAMSGSGSTLYGIFKGPTDSPLIDKWISL